MNLERILPLGALLLLPVATRGVLHDPPAPIAPERDVATLIPDRAVFYVDAPGMPALLEQGLDHPFLKTLLASPLGQLLQTEMEASPEELLAVGEALLGAPVLPTLASMTRHGAALASGFGPKGVAWVLVLHGDDDLIAEEVLTKIFDQLESQFEAPGAFDEPHASVRGADVWYLGDDVKIARRDALVVASSDEGYLRDVLDLAAEPSAKGLAGRASFDEARETRSDEQLLWGWVDLKRVEAVANWSGSGEKMKELRAMNGQPAVQMLLGPGVAALGTSETATFWIATRGAELELGLAGQGVEPAEVLMPDPSRDAPPAPLPHADDCGSLLVYRDLAGAFAHRVDLFPPEMLPKFSKATTDLALFFGGKDLGEDVLPHVSPWIRVVARHPRFDEGVVPEIPLPAAAALVKVDDPATRGPELTAAFQTLISAINLDRAQKGMSPFVMQLETVDGVFVTRAHYPPPGPEDGVDMIYNFVPAAAMVGDVFVIGTHASVVRDLVGEIASGETRPVEGASEAMWLDGPALARVVEDNFDALVMQNMLDEGHDIEAARQEIGGLLGAVQSLERLDAEILYPDDDSVEVRATLVLHADEDEEAVR